MSARARIRVAVVTFAAGASCLVLAVPAGAAPADTVTGGSTTFTSAPGLAAKVIGHGFLPLPADGAQIVGAGGLDDWQQFVMSMRFPAVGGSLTSTSPRTGDVQHTGGIAFTDPLRLRSITFSDFDVVEGRQPYLVARVNGDARHLIRLWELAGGTATATGWHAPLHLTAAGSAAMNAALHTDIFETGELCGYADTTATTG